MFVSRNKWIFLKKKIKLFNKGINFNYLRIIKVGKH